MARGLRLPRWGEESAVDITLTTDELGFLRGLLDQHLADLTRERNETASAALKKELLAEEGLARALKARLDELGYEREAESDEAAPRGEEDDIFWGDPPEYYGH
jgi:hypothetical protein